MIRGMTGYGRGSREQSGLRVSVEVRTTNHRFAEVQLRLPRLLAPAERDLKRRVGKWLGRGRADVFVHLDRTEPEAMPVSLNRALVNGLRAAAEELRRDFGLDGELSVPGVLAFPEAVVTEIETSTELDEVTLELTRAAIDEALQAVEEMRREEGRVIMGDLLPRLETVGRLHKEILARAERVPQEIRQRLRKRLTGLLPKDVELDTARLEQEVAMLADRADVTEELVRLDGYIEQARQVLQRSGGGAGRRLDFLLQEMNREVNTIGSKSSDGEVGTLVVDTKLELERIREQVQNVA